jgi:hypothetical protein
LCRAYSEPGEEEGIGDEKADCHRKIALAEIDEAVAAVNECEERSGEESGELAVGTADYEEGEARECEEEEVEESPCERIAAEEVHDCAFEDERGWHVSVDDVAVGSHAVIFEEDDVVHERSVAHERPMPCFDDEEQETAHQEDCGDRFSDGVEPIRHYFLLLPFVRATLRRSIY